MKYVPLNALDRTYIGEHWNRRLLRGIQCILLATKGKVGTNLDFFKSAFGQSANEFIQIAMMPDEYIINREKHRYNGASELQYEYKALSEEQQAEFLDVVSVRGSIDEYPQYEHLLSHYNKK